MTSSPQIVPAQRRLAGIEPFQGMSDSNRAAFVRAASWRRYRAGERVREQGSEVGEIVFVLAGKARVTTSRRDDPELMLGIFGPGHPSGGFGLFAETYRWRIEALTETETAEIAPGDLLDFLDGLPRAAETVREFARARTAHLARRLHEATVNPAERRLALAFERLREAWGETRELDDGDREIFIPLSIRRRDLAALIDTRTETAIRLVRNWEESGLLRTEEDGFAVADPEHIRELASG